jgi:hypothetical protein
MYRWCADDLLRYLSLPRQSRYAQHRLRVLGRAIELLAISR